MSNMKRIPDYSEADPKDESLFLINNNNSNKKTTMAKIKSFLLGTDTLKTTAQTIKAAINELKDAVDLKALLSNTPIKTTGNLIYYVNVSTGSDSNDGLTSGSAFKTIAKAISKIPQIVNHTVTINVAAGIYSEGIVLVGFMGAGMINVYGSLSNVLNDSNSYSVSNIYINGCASPISIKGFKFTATSADSTVSNSRDVSVSYCRAVEPAPSNIAVIAINASLTAAYNEFSNHSSAIFARSRAIVHSENNTGSGNTTGLVCDSTATIGKQGTQPSGTTAEYAGISGQIR